MRRIYIAVLLLCLCLLLASCANHEDTTNPIMEKAAANATTAQPVQTDGIPPDAQNTPAGNNASSNIGWDAASDGAGGINNVNMNRLMGNPDMCADAHGDIMVSDGNMLYVYQDSSGNVFKADVDTCRVLDGTVSAAEGGADIIDTARDLGEVVGMGIVDKGHICYVTLAAPETDRDNPYLEARKARLFKKNVNDLDAVTEKLDEFYIKYNSKCTIVGSWCYYETSTSENIDKETKKPDGMVGLERRSILDGTVQKIIEYPYKDYPGIIYMTFGQDCLLYTAQERDAATGNASYVTRKMDLATGQSEVVPFMDAMYIAAVYDGYIYYRGNKDFVGSGQHHTQLLRIPLEGGTPELVIDWLEGGVDTAKINIAKDTLYFLWENSLLYQIPLSKIGISRHDWDYTNLYPPVKSTANISPAVSGGLWIWGDNVWAYSNLEGTHPELKALVAE